MSTTDRPGTPDPGAWAGSLVAVDSTFPHVVLTFDDGPEPGGTDRVLAALDEHGATATFFLLVSRARLHPGLLAEVAGSRHEIALHGLDHRRLTGFDVETVRRRTRDAQAELEDLTGRAIRWVRPPYGAQDRGTWQALTSCGLVPVLWGPTLGDWMHISDAERLERAAQGSRAGAILLAHDGYAAGQDGVDDGPAPVLDRGELVGALLRQYAAAGLVGRSLSDALAHGTPVHEERFPF